MARKVTRPKKLADKLGSKKDPSTPRRAVETRGVDLDSKGRMPSDTKRA